MSYSQMSEVARAECRKRMQLDTTGQETATRGELGEALDYIEQLCATVNEQAKQIEALTEQVQKLTNATFVKPGWGDD